MIQLQHITLQRGKKVLLDDAELLIHAGQKIGLIGENGAGKTSLFLLLQGEISCQDGDVKIPSNLTTAHLKQEIPASNTSALDYALEGDKEYTQLQQDLIHAEADNEGLRLAEIHQRLGEIDGYSAPSRAARILTGLGFSQSELEQPVADFSGGWRMRLNLAQLLMDRADFLLLDEPTNHLDLEAIVWLETWLKQSPQTVLLISHDREFLDHVVNHIVHLHAQKLNNYAGNYSSFEKQRAEQLAVQQATYEKQDAKRQHLQKFVDKFRYKASKAKQAQCRLKMLERIEWVSAVHEASPFRFSFRATQSPSSALAQIDKAQIGYTDKVILHNSHLTIHPGDRLGLIGPNGAGKSTLIQVLAQELAVQSGEMRLNAKTKVGYFAQHQLEQLKTSKSPFEHIQMLDAKLSNADIRNYLGGFNFRGDDVFRAVDSFSGGEKARLVLALLIWQSPNLLLLDEPTNHLDLEMREALNLALQNYEGALVVVSHDRYFLKSVTNELYLVAKGKIAAFDGDLDDYQQWLRDHLKQTPATETTISKQKTVKSSEPNKHVARLETKLARLEVELSDADEVLTDNNLYSTENKQQLEDLLVQRKTLAEKIALIEEKILKLL